MFRRRDSLACFGEASASGYVVEDEATAESQNDFSKEQKPAKSRVSSLRLKCCSVFGF
jgi:hypothetical protein